MQTTNEKGTVGELAVRKDLLDAGYMCYLPECDSNQTDLIVEMSNGAFKRVQVKTVDRAKTTTSIEVRLAKHMNTKRVDVVAVYYKPKDIIAYVPYENEITIHLALTTAKNNQKTKRKWFYQYERFPEFS